MKKRNAFWGNYLFRRFAFLYLIPFFHLFTLNAYAYIETTEYVQLEIKKQYKLELPDPIRGYIDQTTWTNDSPDKVSFVTSVNNDEGLVWIVANGYFTGTVTIQCLYTTPYHDTNIGGTRTDTYLRTYLVTCKAPEKQQLSVTMNPSGGYVKAGTQVTLEAKVESSVVSDAEIYYTLNGSTPSKNSTRYTGPITINSSLSIKAIAYHTNYLTSSVKSLTYTVSDHYVGEIIKSKTPEGVEMDFEFLQSYGTFYLQVGRYCIDKAYSGHVTIPSSVDGYTVKAIGKYAFYLGKLTSVTIPSTITEIGEEAFNFAYLKEINIPEGVKAIGKGAFEYCLKAEKLYLPSTVNRIEEKAFYQCKFTTIESKIVTPPTINANVFEGSDTYSMYSKSTLIVPQGSKSTYKSKTGWGQFYNIKEEGGVEPISVSISSSQTIYVGGKATFTATVTPSNAETTFTWDSSNESVASISSSGASATVTGKSAGTAIITVRTANGKSNYAYIYVEKELISISLPASSTIDVTQSITLVATKNPSDATCTLTWSSDKPNVASVTQSGEVKGVSAGTARITVTSSNGKSDYCNVTVKEAEVESVSLPTSATAYIGEPKTLTATITPSYARTTLSWESADESIATVNSSGLVTGVSTGTVKITVTTTNGKTDYCNVTVKEAEVESVNLPTSATAYIGEPKTLTATITPSYARTTLSWESADESIATVNSNGLVTGVSTGTVKITVTTTNGKTDYCNVTVKEAEVESINLPTSATVYIGEPKTLTATITPSYARTTLSWKSADENIATVNSNGLVTGVSMGTVKITVTTANRKTNECNVTIKPMRPTSVTLTKNDTVYIGNTLTLAPRLLPTEAVSTISWSSSDESIATVNTNGIVYPQSEGTARITVTTDNGLSDYCDVVVKSIHVTNIHFDNTSETLIMGERRQLEVTILPENASNKALTWISSNNEVVEVSNDGHISAKKGGNAVITCCATDGSGIKATCNITVEKIYKYVRIKNVATDRYMYFCDNTGSIDYVSMSTDMGAVQLWRDCKSMNHLTNPANIISYECNQIISSTEQIADLQAQNTSIHSLINEYVHIKGSIVTNEYQIYVSSVDLTFYLDDETTTTRKDQGVLGSDNTGTYRMWNIDSINQTDNYLGVAPSVTANGKFYAPYYIAFPFSFYSSGMKAYYISVVDKERALAVMKEVTGTIPAALPVIIECSSNDYANNKLTLRSNNITAPTDNKLQGIYFSNPHRAKSGNAKKKYDANTMRVLGLTSEGKLGYITATTDMLNLCNGMYCLQANQSYLPVATGTPAELTIVSEEEYKKILSGVESIGIRIREYLNDNTQSVKISDITKMIDTYMK